MKGNMNCISNSEISRKQTTLHNFRGIQKSNFTQIIQTVVL